MKLRCPNCGHIGLQPSGKRVYKRRTKLPPIVSRKRWYCPNCWFHTTKPKRAK